MYCFTAGVYCFACYVWFAVFQWLNHAFPLNFAAHLATHEMPKWLLVTMPWGKWGLLTSFHDSYVAGTSTEECEHLGDTSTCHTDWNMENVCKILNKDKVQFCRSVCNMEYASNSKVELEHMANLCKVCALVSHQQVEWEAIFGCWNMAVVSDLSYSPHLAPYDFFLFLRMKSQLKGIISKMSLQFRNTYWPSYMWFQKVRYCIASSNGRSAVPTA